MTFQCDGLSKMIQSLENAQHHLQEITNCSMYEGVRVIKNGIEKEIRSMSMDDKRRAGLLGGLVVKKYETNEYETKTKICFVGYNGRVTAKYTGGEPNALVARSIAKGNSKGGQGNFVERAYKNNKDASAKAIKAEFEARCKKYDLTN